MLTRLRLLLMLALMAAAATFVLPGEAWANRVLGLLTPSLGYELDPGEMVTGQVVAINDGDEPALVYVYPASQRFDNHGTVDYYAPTGSRIAVDEPATWISLDLPLSQLPPADTPSVLLDPGERLPVDYIIRVPSDAAAGDHSIIVFFEMRDETASANEAAVGGRLGTRIKLRTSGDILRRLRIELFEVPACIIGNEVDYRFLLSNTGNVDASTTVTLDAIGRHDEPVSSSTIASQTVAYAHSVIENQGRMLLPKGALGFYTLRLTSDNDWGDAAPSETTKERAVFAIPIWLLITVGVIALMIQLRIWWNINERKRRKKLEERRRRRAEARQNESLGSQTPADDEPESA